MATQASAGSRPGSRVVGPTAAAEATVRAVGLDVDAIASRMEARLSRVGVPERAAAEKAYLKTDVRFLGTPVPQVRRLARALAAELGALGSGDVLAVAGALWSAPVHERRMAAVELLVLYREALGPEAVEAVERLIRGAGTWALVDGLAERVAGPLVERHPELGATLDRWAVDADFWVRRSALLALLPALRRGRGDFERFSRYADGMLDDKEFFIRKAIGWVLREAGKQRPDRVAAWLAPRTHRASGVTVREAVKYLGEERRELLLAAYRQHRPAELS